jgi:acetyltransferase-like isoleucine patch superfamily enzyme
MFTEAIKRLWLARLKAQGLRIASDCRLMGFPNFGSEPYLISIGPRVTVSFGVSFITHDGGTFVFRSQPEYEKIIKYGRITVHENCFIGAHSVLMPNVVIGPNSVVAAGAVVTKDVPPNMVVGGVPARVMCKVAEYANSSLRKCPKYDELEYNRNKKRELLRIFPGPW